MLRIGNLLASRFSLMILFVCAVVPTLALGARNWSLGKKEAASRASSTTAQARQAPKQFFRVWVHRNEIMPDLIYARPGRALLRAENETSGDIELVVERVNQHQPNALQAQIRTVNKGKRADSEIVLQPGEYVFFTPALPQLKGKLVVEDRN